MIAIRMMDECTVSQKDNRSSSSITTTKKIWSAMDVDNENKRNSNNYINDDITDIDNNNTTTNRIKINGDVDVDDSNSTSSSNRSDEAPNNHTSQKDGDDRHGKPKVHLGVTKKKDANNKPIKKIEKDKKPTRPLSAYNFFFREERVNWLKEEKHAVGDDDDDEGGNHSQHCPVFESMAKEVGKRWKELDATKRRKYIDMAKIETERYQWELRQFKEQKKKDGRQQKKNETLLASQTTSAAVGGAAANSRETHDEVETTNAAAAANSWTAFVQPNDPGQRSSLEELALAANKMMTENPPQQRPPKKRIIIDGPNQRGSNNNNNTDAIVRSDRHDNDDDDRHDRARRPEGSKPKKKQKKTMMNASVPVWGSSNGEDPNQKPNIDSSPSATFRQAGIDDGRELDRPQYPTEEQILRERFLLMQQQNLAGLISADATTATTRSEQETSSMIESLLLRQQEQQQQQLLQNHPNGSSLPSSTEIDLSMLTDEQLQALAEQRGIRSKAKNNHLFDHPSAMLLANPKSLRDLYGGIGIDGMMGTNGDKAATAAAAAAADTMLQHPTNTTTNPMQELLLRRHLLEQQQRQQQLQYLQRLEQQQILQQQQQQLQQKLRTSLPLPATTLPSFANNNNNMSLVDEIRLRQRFGLPIPKHLLQELNGHHGSGVGIGNDDGGVGGMFLKQRLTAADALPSGNMLDAGKGGLTNKQNDDKAKAPLLRQIAAAAVDDDYQMLHNHNNMSHQMNDYKNLDRSQLLRLLAMKQQQQNMIQSNNPYY